MYYYPGDYSSISSTKGHSILRQRAYGVPHKRPPSDVYIPFSPKIRHHHGEISTDVFLPRHHYYSHAEEDSLNRTVGEELATSSAAMDDSYNMAFKSRDRDHQLMSDLNQAIVSSEAHSSPKAAVASRRATRQQQHVVTPHTHVPRHVPHRRTHKEVVVAHSSVMKPTPYEHVIVLPVHLVAKPRLQVVKKVVLEEDKKRAAAIQSWRSVVIRKPVHVSKVGRPKVHHHVTYVPPKRNFMPKRHIRARQKAALIGHKVDIVLPVRRMPKVYRSVPKLRTHIHVKEDGRLPSSRLHAHVPGYRLEARAKPTDMLFHSEHAYESMKDRVLDAQDKLDRHRQLLDRYLTPHLGPETEDVSSQVLNKYTELEARDPLGADGYYIPPSHDAGGHSHHHHHEPHVDVNMIGRPSRQPVSDLRKRIRRVICKSKRDAGYYN